MMNKPDPDSKSVVPVSAAPSDEQEVPTNTNNTSTSGTGTTAGRTTAGGTTSGRDSGTQSSGEPRRPTLLLVNSFELREPLLED